jgi:hypothetical protein
MSSYTHRPLRNASEFIAMQQFTARMAIEQAPYYICLPGDLAWWRGATPDDSGLAGIRLWNATIPSSVGLRETDDQVDSLYDTRYPNLSVPNGRLCSATHGFHHFTLASEKNPTRHTALIAHGYALQPLALNQHYQPTSSAPVFALPEGWPATTLRRV